MLRLHGMSLVQFGGLPGLRDAGLLESALAPPEQLSNYAKPDVADIAAAYAFGLTKNHPFIDGNKRATFLVLGLSSSVARRGVLLPFTMILLDGLLRHL